MSYEELSYEVLRKQDHRSVARFANKGAARNRSDPSAPQASGSLLLVSISFSNHHIMTQK